MAHLENYAPEYNQYQNNADIYLQSRANRNGVPSNQFDFQPEYKPSIEHNFSKKEITPSMYRDELDKAVYNNVERNAYDRMPTDEYKAISPQRANFQERRETENRNIYGAPEQYNSRANETGNRIGSRQDRGRSEGYGYDQHNVDMNRYPGQAGGIQQPQQTNANDQLASKIKTNGYRQQNLHVWNLYHKAYEQKEKDMIQFELNVVDKAAREKIVKDDARMKADWEKKQRLEKQTFDSNRKNLETMINAKRRERDVEIRRDNQRVHDALVQFEREDQIKKQIMEKMKQENNMILDIQKRDFSAQRPGRRNPRYSSNLLRNSIDNAGYDGSLPEIGHATPMRYSGVRTRERPEEKIVQSSMIAKIGDMSLKDPYTREEENPQRYVKDDFTSGRNAQMRESGSNIYQEKPFVLNHSASAKDQYVKIRDRVRFGAAFNIITNEQKQG